MTVHAFAWTAGVRKAWADHDSRQDARVMLTVSAVIGLLFAVATSVQSVLAMGVYSSTLRGLPSAPVVELVLRGVINVGTVCLVLALVALFRPERRSFPIAVLQSILIVVGCALVRALAQIATGVYADRTAWVAFAEIITTSAACLVTLLIGFAMVGAWRRLRAGERERVQSQLETVLAYRELQEEELRVRREVAQGIHGSVQSVFVMLEAELDEVATHVDPAEAERLRRASGTVRDLRERELRSLSGVLYPVDLDRGLDPALTALVMRLPAHVAVEARFHDVARSLDARATLPPSTRLLLVRTAEEALSNALRHGGASAVAVDLQFETPSRVHLVVDDDGSGPPEMASWSGLDRLRRHLDLLGGSLVLERSAALGGAALTAVAPVDVEPAAAP
ncbi:sensor histidine kinase [Cnuibacter sp. UC19_7]|uniref:sensor histidine kinase n=1 Tax=Cnuibacter sp. UC19_7 TaxID=3350166 RepID=UPI00366FE360